MTGFQYGALYGVTLMTGLRFGWKAWHDGDQWKNALLCGALVALALTIYNTAPGA